MIALGTGWSRLPDLARTAPAWQDPAPWRSVLGRAARLPDDSPSEVRPLVQDLNALIDANAEMIRCARAQAGNLAHALKTPLAILVDEGASG